MRAVEYYFKIKSSNIFYLSICISIMAHSLLLFGFLNEENSSKINISDSQQSEYILINYSSTDNVSVNELNSINESNILQSNSSSSSLEQANSNSQSSRSEDAVKHILESYEQSVLKKIHKNKYYPLIARKMQLTGIIKLRFVLTSDGSLVNNIQILDKCEHQILNMASLRTIQLASPFSPFPDEIKSKQKVFIVKIKYQQDLF